MSDLPTLAEPYLIAEEFCGGCGRSIGFDVRPFTIRCEICQMIFDKQADDSSVARDEASP